MIQNRGLLKFLQLAIIIFFGLGTFSTLTVEAGRTCCVSRTGASPCDYCGGADTKTNTIVGSAQGGDTYGCGGNTSGGFVQYNSANNAICRVCPTDKPFALSCGDSPPPVVVPPNPACGGACTNNSQCPLVDGRVQSVCNLATHICVNPNCPNDSQLGSQCFCTNNASKCGDKCGNWPTAQGGKFPLCGDGVSSCAPLSGPACVGLNITYCQPSLPAAGYTRPVCTAEPTYRYLVRPNGTIATTQADVIAACTTCNPTAPGPAILYYPAPGAIINSATPTLNVSTTIDLTTNGWGTGCPTTINSWSLSYSINSGAWQTVVSNVIPNVPVGATVRWYVTKSNASLTATTATIQFTVAAACIPSAPSAATLTNPADGSTIGLLSGNSVNVGYTVGAWGTSCAGTQTTTLQISRGCTGTFVNNPSPTVITGLAINDLVCWRVQKNNGSLSSTSATWSFTVKPDEKPWLLGYNGNVYAGGGIQGFNVPGGLASLSGNLNDRSNAKILDDLQSTFTSTYSLVSGTASIPSDRQSKLKQFTSNYTNLSVSPPADTGVPLWYDYIYGLVTKNATATINNLAPGDATLATTSSALVVTGQGTKRHIVITGNLNVVNGSTCDTQSIIFVTGNITFTPDFTVGGSAKYQNGCLFVARGNITILPGNPATAAILTDSSQLANYDLIEAGLITDGILITPKDVINPNTKGDGLAVKGSVISKDVTLQRDINLNANQIQPAQLFYYDPRYREIFKNDLNYSKYSLREEGYTN